MARAMQRRLLAITPKLPAFHPVLPVIGAFTPAKVMPQTRNPALDARTPAIAALPTACALERLMFI